CYGDWHYDAFVCELSYISVKELNVDRRVPLFILISAVLLPGTVMAAQAQHNEQNSSTQQQSSQQHAAKQDRASDNNDNSKAEDDGNGSGSRQQEDLAGTAQHQNLIAAQKPGQILSSSRIGMTVRNKDKSIGRVKTLILDKDYKVVGFVVDMSGMTGLIQKSLGIAWRAVQDVDPEEGDILVQVNSNNLQDIRTF